MKYLSLFPLLPLAGSALVIVNEQVLDGLAVEEHHRGRRPAPLEDTFHDVVEASEELYRDVKHAVEDEASKIGDEAKSLFDYVVDTTADAVHGWEERFDAQGWMDSASFEEEPEERPHHPPGKRPHRRPHHGPPRRHPHHKSNKTVYELIAESKYTTELAKLVSKYDDLVELLNGTTANFTVFAPTDAAFKKIPKHAPKPSKEFLKQVLTYHVAPCVYPAGRVLFADTIATAYNESLLEAPQRLSVRLSLRGLVVNFYSRVVAANIFASNGVIHGVDSLLLPPPKAYTILNFLPAEFSTLLLALEKTGLGEKLNSTKGHVGGTIFAPGNAAFKKLGPGPNAFLFSPHGLKYLKALLEYHVTPNQTLYSDAFYKAEASQSSLAAADDDDVDRENEEEDETTTTYPRRTVHVDLPTALEGRSLPVDIIRIGPFVEMRVNGFSRVSVKNGIAKDGVIHAVNNVLIPPKTPGGAAAWDGETEMTVDELRERLEPYVVDDDEQEQVKEELGREAEEEEEDEDSFAGWKWEM